MSAKEITINFLISFMSIFLGMLCTFVGQGMIDRAADRKEICTALELVRAELSENKDDIVTMLEIVDQERESAQYFLDKRAVIDRCPEDSISFHGANIFAEVSISLRQDALELLKSSSLFQKIADNNTSLKIIRAYASCMTAASSLNKYETDKDEKLDNILTDQYIRKTADTGKLGIDVRKSIKSNYGLLLTRWMAQPLSESVYDMSDVDGAIKAIDSYLGKRAFRRLRK